MDTVTDYFDVDRFLIDNNMMLDFSEVSYPTYKKTDAGSSAVDTVTSFWSFWSFWSLVDTVTDDFDDVDRSIDWDDGYVAWLFGISWGDGYVDWGRYCVISEIGLGSDGIAALILGSRTGSRTLYGASQWTTPQI